MLNQLKTYKTINTNAHSSAAAHPMDIWLQLLSFPLFESEVRMKARLSPFGYRGARLPAHAAAGVPTQDNFIHRLRLWSFSSADSQMKRSTRLRRSRLQRWGTLVPLTSHICIWARASIETYRPKTTDSLRYFSDTSPWAHTHTLSDPETLPVMPGAWKIKTYKLFLH